MHSGYRTNNQSPPKRSLIEEARRAQIVAAAIETLADIGYGRASLAQIAKRAQISPSLIPYHFRDKDALIFQTLTDIAAGWESYVAAQVAAAATPTEQLRSYITATLAYMGTRPSHYAALIEIVFNLAFNFSATPLGRLLGEGGLFGRIADTSPLGIARQLVFVVVIAVVIVVAQRAKRKSDEQTGPTSLAGRRCVSGDPSGSWNACVPMVCAQ